MAMAAMATTLSSFSGLWHRDRSSTVLQPLNRYSALSSNGVDLCSASKQMFCFGSKWSTPLQEFPNSNAKHWRQKSTMFTISATIRQLTGSITKIEGLRFAVVAARFNDIITKRLVEGALEAFRRHSVSEEDIDVVWVPGSFEMPVVAQTLAKSGNYHAVICIGAVIRGDTSHYDAVANSAASGVLSAGLNSGTCFGQQDFVFLCWRITDRQKLSRIGVPCIFGVLTCDSMEQAIDRAGGKAGNKGAEAAVTAIEMASLFQHHLKC